MREIVLDTETTGLDPSAGHRLVEIGCVELFNLMPTGQTFQRYLDPERDMPDDAYRVHGLSTAFLAGQPRFAAVVDELFAFIGDAPVVIHNAGFDLGFINAELARLSRPPFPVGRAIDTVLLARQRFPGARASLDALCQRFAIDLSGRTEHGALKDARLLARVYLELKGGLQPGFELKNSAAGGPRALSEVRVRPPRPHAPTADELARHEAFVDTLKDPIWRD